MSDQLLTLTIASTSAGELTGRFNMHMKAGPLKIEGMARLGLDPSMAKSYRILYNGQPLDENKTLAELRIPDRAVLLIEPEAPEVI